jgi:hypothetical protein
VLSGDEDWGRRRLDLRGRPAEADASEAVPGM